MLFVLKSPIFHKKPQLRSGLRSLQTMNLFTRFFQENQEKFLAFAYKQKRIMPMLRWTARIATVTIIGYFITSDFRYNKEIQLQTITVRAGQRAQIILADGMRV